MKKKLKAISAELKKASKTHAGQAAKIDKIIKPKMSKLNKSSRMKRPKFIGPKIDATSVSPDMAPASTGKGPSAIGKIGGILGIAGSAIGIMQGLKGLKGKRQKPKGDKEKKAIGRVQKPYLSKKKKEIAKYNISGFVSKHTGLKPGRYEKAVIMNGVRNAAPSRRKQVLEKLKTNAGTAAMFKKPKLSKKKK